MRPMASRRGAGPLRARAGTRRSSSAAETPAINIAELRTTVQKSMSRTADRRMRGVVGKGAAEGRWFDFST